MIILVVFLVSCDRAQVNKEYAENISLNTYKQAINVYLGDVYNQKYILDKAPNLAFIKDFDDLAVGEVFYNEKSTQVMFLFEIINTDFNSKYLTITDSSGTYFYKLELSKTEMKTGEIMDFLPSTDNGPSSKNK